MYSNAHIPIKIHIRKESEIDVKYEKSTSLNWYFDIIFALIRFPFEMGKIQPNPRKSWNNMWIIIYRSVFCLFLLLQRKQCWVLCCCFSQNIQPKPEMKVHRFGRIYIHMAHKMRHRIHAHTIKYIHKCLSTYQIYVGWIWNSMLCDKANDFVFTIHTMRVCIHRNSNLQIHSIR